MNQRRAGDNPCPPTFLFSFHHGDSLRGSKGVFRSLEGFNIFLSNRQSSSRNVAISGICADKLSHQPQILIHCRPAQPTYPRQLRDIQRPRHKRRIMLVEYCGNIVLCGLRSSYVFSLDGGSLHPGTNPRPYHL